MDINWVRVLEDFMAEGLLLGALTATFAYLTKTILSHWLTKELEQYKRGQNEALEEYKRGQNEALEQYKRGQSELLEHTKAQLKLQGDLELERTRAGIKSQQDQSLEIMRTELRAMAVEHEARISRLQERRAGVLMELYALLVDAEDAFQRLVSPMQTVTQKPDEDRHEAIRRGARERQKAVVDTIKPFLKYFEHNRIVLEPSTCSLIEEFNRRHLDAWHDYTWLDDPDDLDADLRAQYRETRENSRKVVQKELPAIRAKLEADFRRLLGVSGSRDALPKSGLTTNGVGTVLSGDQV